MKLFTVSSTCEIPSVVASLCGGNPLEKRIVFCEDKFTLALELAIAKEHGGTFGTNVFSFNRYMHKHLESSKKLLSTEGSTLVIKGILLKNKSELTCFKRVNDPNLASTVYELIAQLKSAKVTPNDIKNAIDKTSGNLKRKLKDIYLIFNLYEEYIESHNLTDGNNRLYRLPKHFSLSEEIKDTHVIIAGFPSLNRTLCEIFKAICARAKRVDFVVVAGQNKGVYTNELYNFVTFEYPNVENVEKGDYSIRNQLLDGLFNPNMLSQEGKYSSHVHLHKASDIIQEVEHVAQIIKRSVINGASYKDFSVCAEDIASYELTLRRVFEEYDIPLFYDASKNLAKHPITRLVCSYLDLARRNFDKNDLFAFVKNPLMCPNKSISDGFENYYIANSINRRTVKQPFSAREVEDENAVKFMPEYEQIRSMAVNVVEYLAGVNDFNDICQAIYKMLESINAFDNLKGLTEGLTRLNRAEISAYNEQAEEKFNAVISDALAILGEVNFSLAEAKNVILSGMTACKVSVIPEYNDCVFVGDFRSVRYNSVKNLFVLGLNDGVPVSKIDTALLCDRDIAKMEEVSVLVEPKIKEVNRRSREVACMAISSFTEHLYLSYSQALPGGTEGKMSEIMRYVTHIFSQKDKKTLIYTAEDYKKASLFLGENKEKNYKIKSYLTKKSAIKSFAEDISSYKEGKSEDFLAGSAFYKAIKEETGDLASLAGSLLTASNAQVEYTTEGVDYAEGKLSATAIEGYFECPYANFLKKGVKLLEREESDIKANDLGTMVHDVGETFINKIDWTCSKEEALDLANSIFESVIQKDAYARYLKSEGGKRAFELIKKESQSFCMSLFNAGNHSSLKPKFIEVYFGGAKYPPIKVNTRKGEMKITGKIDRIDSDGENMSVIDYKTGAVNGSNADLNLYTGKKLQLFLYAKAFSDKLKPLGAYYFPISNDFKEEIEQTQMSYVGKTIADEQQALLIDDTLVEGGKSTYLNANFMRKKDGTFRYPQYLLSEKEFNAYMKYSEQVAGEGLSEISEGVIIPSPYEGACAYCQFLGLCGYLEESDNRTRKIAKVEKVDILRAVNMAGEENKGGEE